MKALRKIMAIVLVMVTLCTALILPTSAAKYSYAAWKNAGITSSNYCRTFTISRTGKTIPYTSESLTTRGTVNKASNNAYIDNAADQLYVLKVDPNGKWALVSYPTPNGRVKAYIKLSAITGSSASGNAYIATKKFSCAKRWGDAVSSSYYAAKGDTVYLMGEKDSWYQIMYPIDAGGWRLAWVKKTTFNSCCTEIKSFSLSWSTKTIEGVGSKIYLTASISPSSLRSYIKWDSSKESVAKVQRDSSVTNANVGVVTARGAGTATITASIPGTKWASSLKITVNASSNSGNTGGNNSSDFNPIWPVKEQGASSPFNITTMYFYRGLHDDDCKNSNTAKQHSTRSHFMNGIDIGTTGTAVAVAGGTVKEVGCKKDKYGNYTGFGNYVVIDHGDYLSLYAHLAEGYVKVKEGQTISTGDEIGRIGDTGAQGSVHLHFELYKENRTNEIIDPFLTYYITNHEYKDKMVIPKESILANLYVLENNKYCSKGDCSTRNALTSEEKEHVEAYLAYIQEYMKNLKPQKANFTVTVTKDGANINIIPCSMSTNHLAVTLYDAGIGQVLTVVNTYTNSSGSVWYEVKLKGLINGMGDATGFIYAGNVKK